MALPTLRSSQKKTGKQKRPARLTTSVANVPPRIQGLQTKRPWGIVRTECGRRAIQANESPASLPDFSSPHKTRSDQVGPPLKITSIWLRGSILILNSISKMSVFHGCNRRTPAARSGQVRSSQSTTDQVRSGQVLSLTPPPQDSAADEGCRRG